MFVIFLGKKLILIQLTIPFENMGQHEHPEGGPGVSACPAVPPTLDVNNTLEKLITSERGGFCWEINFAFQWLLRKLGFSVRMGNSFVMTPGGPIPGHLVLFVDNLDGKSYLADPGFGDQPREPVPLGTLDGSAEPVCDPMIGDSYKLELTSDFGERWNALLMRQRAAADGTAMVDLMGMPADSKPTPFQPVYTVNTKDDLELDCQEFKDGLQSVLTPSPMNLFTSKRFATIPTKDGYVIQTPEYVKVRAGGKVVKNESLADEAAYRASLKEHFGIVL